MTNMLIVSLNFIMLTWNSVNRRGSILDSQIGFAASPHSSKAEVYRRGKCAGNGQSLRNLQLHSQELGKNTTKQKKSLKKCEIHFKK